MVPQIDKLHYINQVTGKEILVVYDDVQKCYYNFLIDSFIPANPSNHLFDNTLSGRDLQPVMAGISGVTHGNQAITDQALITRLEGIEVHKWVWPGQNWVKIVR